MEPKIVVSIGTKRMVFTPIVVKAKVVTKELRLDDEE